MIVFFLLLPAVLMFLVSFVKTDKIANLLPFISFTIIIPNIMLFKLPFPYHLIGDYLIVDKLGDYIFLVSSVVSIGVSLALMTLHKHVNIKKRAYNRFYRFFALFWLGLILSTLSNNMGIYWVGLEFATLSTVYMIKINYTNTAHREAWNYMIVDTIAISIILFGIILIYASAKPILGDNAMNFDALLLHVKEIKIPFLFEIGFAVTTVGMFIKLGMFPMNLWLADIERASFYPVPALFSGILESAVMIGFFKFSKIIMQIDYTQLFGFIFIYSFLTIFIIAFLIYRAKDFIRLFSFSGIEHMALIALFWVSGGTFAALLHFSAHAFLKPSLFLSTGVLESNGKYHIAGALKGYKGIKGKIFWFIVGLFLLAIVSVPPSPMFFSEIYGFGAMINMAKHTHYLPAMIAAIVLLLILLSMIFYRFTSIYQSMKYEGADEEKKVYTSEIVALLILGASLLLLLLPQSMEYLRSIS